MVSVESESLSKSDEVGGSRVGGDDGAAEGTEKVNGDVNDADCASAVEANGETLPSVDSSEPDSKVVATPPQDGSSASDAVPAPTSTPTCETTAKKGGVHISGRGITLEMLLKDGFVKPGPGALTVELEGKKRKGTLLKNGHIQDETSDTTFTSVTAWAIYACNALSPAFKPPSGTTWCSQIRHKGKSLDHYKCQWCYMRQDKHKRGDFGDRSFSKKKRVVRPEEAGVRPGCEADRDLLIQCQPFQRYGKMQPFNVTVSLSAYILMDLHSSITLNEVSGYLGGTWDLNNHILHVKAAYPCRCRPGDSENAAMVEYDIAMNMEKANHTVVGWYHSHPQFPPYPSIADTECQLEYQMKMKGNTDAAYTPCVGMITAPFQDDSGSLETIVGCFWVMPPPETRPMDPPIPMLLEYLPVPEPLPDRDVEEAKLLFDFYKESSEFINSVHILRDEVTYWDKLESTLKPKLMAAENGPKLWDVIYNAFIEPDESNVVDVVEPQVKQEAPVVHEEEEPKMEEVPEAVEVPPKEGNDSVDDAAPVVGLIEESTERVEQVEEEPNLLENPSQDEHDVEVPIVETDTPLATPLQGCDRFSCDVCEFGIMDGSPVPRVERTVSFLFRSLDGDMIENDGNSVGFDNGVTLEARLAKCKARLQQYVEDDSLRKRRNSALLADAQKLKEELNGFCLEDYFSVQERARPERVNMTRMTPMGELSVPKPSATTGTDTEDLDYQSSSREHVDATAQTRESDFRDDSEDRLVEEVRVPIARKESSSTSEASYLVQSRRSSAGIPGLRRQSSTFEHLDVEEGEEGSQTDYEIGAVDHGDVQSKQTIAEMPSKMEVEQKIVGAHETSLYSVDIVNHHRSADDTAQDVRVEEVAGSVPDERILEAASSQEDEKRLVVDDRKRPPSVISREASEPSSNPNQRDSSTVDDDSFFDEGGTAVNAAYLKLLGGTSEPRKASEGGMEDVDEDMETRIATKLVENASEENASSQQPASQARANMGNILKKVAGESDEDVSLEGGHASDKDDDFF